MFCIVLLKEKQRIQLERGKTVVSKLCILSTEVHLVFANECNMPTFLANVYAPVLSKTRVANPSDIAIKLKRMFSVKHSV